MNRLQNETSPYLLQHKDNPVDWHPWGKEALKKALVEDKPILLSIGYSACHWCHVMEHESFENEKISGMMNQLFINIKVDREERPDIDQIYMNYVQMTTGHGGWPLTVFLTPNLVPFYGGTYFPPIDKYGRPGFPRILKLVAETYQTKKEEIFNSEKEIIKSISGRSESIKGYGVYEDVDFDNAFNNIKKTYDEKWGGFGSAPKFPGSMTHQYLLRYFKKTGNVKALEMVEHSLTIMAKGGMYDQVGGGFHRYSTDDEWLVPHFEKMLYDNALLSRLYLEAYQTTQNNFYLFVAQDILHYIMKEMTDESGGFYSAQDADSEGEEGKFFIWKENELNSFLDETEQKITKKYFGITTEGNFEGENILTTRNSKEMLADELGVSLDYLNKKILSIRSLMYNYREKRVKPGTDDKILTSWNALMLNSFALAYGITSNNDFLQAAIKNASFIWDKCFRDNTLFHSYKNGELKYKGYLDNYTYTAEAFIKLYEVTFDELWLERADTLMQIILNRFYDKNSYDFYYTEESSEDLIIRTKDLHDGALPGGNSVAYFVMLKLGIYLNNDNYRQIAAEGLKNMQQVIIKYPTSFSYLLITALFEYIKIDEIAVIAKDENEKNKVINSFHTKFFPFTIVAGKISGNESKLELFNNRNMIENKSTYYVCRNYTCDTPVNSFEKVEQQLLK